MIFLDVHIENLGERIVFSLALLSAAAGFLLKCRAFLQQVDITGPSEVRRSFKSIRSMEDPCGGFMYLSRTDAAGALSL